MFGASVKVWLFLGKMETFGITELLFQLNNRAFKALETVVLVRDIPKYGLRKGDLGAVVEVYEPDGLEVEFVTASGKTEALATLKLEDVRAVADTDRGSIGYEIGING